uniref:Tripartite motif containing 4 n=1 Tax=Neovison vison TaxID=452646 RepID=A0A8C7A4Y5_NEOVI
MEAEDLQEDLTCAICLDYFEDPVSIECGHNFCRGCLHRSWGPGGGSFPCPECRQPSSFSALRPNWALARLTERARRRRQGPVPPGQCGRHWEALRLFCEDDQRPVCLVCRESQEHQGHTMAPIDEASCSYRVSGEEFKKNLVRLISEFCSFLFLLEKLLKAQSSLKDKMKKALYFQDMEVKNATAWKVTEAEGAVLLPKEKKVKKKNHTLGLEPSVGVGSLGCPSCLRKRVAFSAFLRSENQDVDYSPEVLTVKNVCQIPMMKEMLKRFQVAVSVAEDTAHPKLVFSQDGRFVKNGASASSWPLFSSAWSYFSGWRNSQKNAPFVGRFQHLPCVLGKNIFTSGKHYWEVESRDGLEIAVGVCREDVMGLVDASEMCPHGGIWALSWGSAGSQPLTGSSGSPTKQEPALHRVGVFLDFGARDISFYSAVDGAHLHTFSCPVSRLRPFFWLSPLASLVIPAVTGGK